MPANPDKGVEDGPPTTAGDMLRAPYSIDNDGVATAGVFLINQDDDPQSDPGKRDQFCPASSVASPCTASPRSRKGKVWIDGRHLSLGTQKADDLDFAFLRTGPNSKGQFLENATGMGNELTTLPASGNLNQKNVTLIGFPRELQVAACVPQDVHQGVRTQDVSWKSPVTGSHRVSPAARFSVTSTASAETSSVSSAATRPAASTTTSPTPRSSTQTSYAFTTRP
ncbi:hypothetical protein ABZY36_38410 [Streptomyces sp. NPDC006627]|uniref:hypothetical protein n=1 Tax=Streptomyces sp. NPDC006627 TaxID=3154679 RepID=UPI0033B7B487